MGDVLRPRGTVSKFKAPSLAHIQKQVATIGLAERFFDSVVLFTLFELGVFTELAGGPRTLDSLCEKLGANRATLASILDAAVALKVLKKDGDEYSADEALLDCLGRPDSESYVGEWIAFLHTLSAPLMELDQAALTGKPPGNLVEDGVSDNLLVRRMTHAMDSYARTRGIEMAGRMDWSKTKTLLDLGCGPGTYSLAIVEEAPHIKATLLDLDLPIEDARKLVEARGMSDRVTFVAHDIFTYQTDEGFDDVMVSNTLHMLGPDLSAKLMKQCFTLVNPGGRLIVQAQYLNDDRTSPRWATLLNLVQRAATIHGQNHALGETREWMEAAGFVDVEHQRFSAWNTNSVLIGRKPA